MGIWHVYLSGNYIQKSIRIYFILVHEYIFFFVNISKTTQFHSVRLVIAWETEKKKSMLSKEFEFFVDFVHIYIDFHTFCTASSLQFILCLFHKISFKTNEKFLFSWEFIQCVVLICMRKIELRLRLPFSSKLTSKAKYTRFLVEWKYLDTKSKLRKNWLVKLSDRLQINLIV